MSLPIESPPMADDREKRREKTAAYQKEYREKHREERAAYRREWRANNMEKVRKASEKWRENNPEKVRKTSEEWRENNPEKVRKASKEWYANNRETIRERYRNNRENKEWCARNREKRQERYRNNRENKEWCARNREKLRERYETNRTDERYRWRSLETGAKRRGIVITPDFKEAFGRMFGTTCHYCGTACAFGIDRVINGVRLYMNENCVSCCGTCNMMKKEMLPDEFLDHAARIVDHTALKKTAVPDKCNAPDLCSPSTAYAPWEGS